MNSWVLSFLIALGIAVIDVVPMVIKKLPRHTNLAAFVHYFVMSVVIVNLDLPGIPWWIEGGVVGFALTVPMMIHVAQVDRKPLPIIATNAIVLGTLAGVAAHFLM